MAEAAEARSDSLAATTAPEPLGARLRRAATAALFAVILLIPKLLHVRRDPRAWLAFRVVLGLLGAALVVVPLGLWNSWLAAVCGLALFLTAALLGPAAPVTSLDDKARELGALVVVNGGEYIPAQGFHSAGHLFVGAENLWALDSAFAVLTVIPVAQISSVAVLASPSGSVLHIEWPDHAAEFGYHGFFAEHLARVAESTIRSVMRPSLPIIQRAAEPAARGRAAGA
jgi:hypothetical protein